MFVVLKGTDRINAGYQSRRAATRTHGAGGGGGAG